MLGGSRPDVAEAPLTSQAPDAKEITMEVGTRTARIATIAAATAAVVGLTVPAAGARTSYNGNACTLLAAKQVAALHIGTSCARATGRANPYYAGTTAIWGKPGTGKGSVVVSANKVKQAAYIGLFESQSKQGTSFGVGSWSRSNCAAPSVECLVVFVTGAYVIELKVAPPAHHPLASSKPVLALARSIAARL
jgi:hypothetical protein